VGAPGTPHGFACVMGHVNIFVTIINTVFLLINEPGRDANHERVLLFRYTEQLKSSQTS